MSTWEQILDAAIPPLGGPTIKSITFYNKVLRVVRGPYRDAWKKTSRADSFVRRTSSPERIGRNKKGRENCSLSHPTLSPTMFIIA